MDTGLKISCIIPFWNEGCNLIEVLEEVTRVSNISEIICVDDASDDSNHLLVRKKFPQVKILRLESNTGKTGAIREGLKHAANKLVLLLDADLRNLDHSEIENAVLAFRKTADLDMLILRRVNAEFFVKLYRADVLFTGERILKKSDLETILEGDVTGWQLESAINTWMYHNGKNVLWIAHSAVNRHKSLKWGMIDGLKLDLRTYHDMVSATGLSNMLRQIFFFAREELKAEQDFK